MKDQPQDNATRRSLVERIRAIPLEWPWRPTRHETGDRLDVAVSGVHPRVEGRVEMEILRFVGGGFAGQVYQVRIESVTGDLAGLSPGQICAIKVLKPPSSFSLVFRNFLYWLAYQASFAVQVNPDAQRAGALWQKLIRRAMALETGRSDAVCDIHAIFLDEALRSQAEISEWVTGRNWLLEIDEHVFSRWRSGAQTWTAPKADVQSPEYLNKRAFMALIVRVMHAMGAPELARQYEWYSLKSQPNAMKRQGSGPGPADGLTAIDFRAGLALLPFLPMSPVDLRLVVQGLLRGALVQFDRGDVDQLRRYVEARREAFEDLLPLVDELAVLEPAWRSTQPDLTHHGFRLLFDARLRGSVREGFIRSWQANGIVDADHGRRLRDSTLGFLCFLCMGAIPLMGGFLRKLWGEPRRRRHLVRSLSDLAYLGDVLRVHFMSRLITWNRSGRLGSPDTLRLADQPVRFVLHLLLLSWMPGKIHRFFAEPRLLWQRIVHAVAYPIKLYVDPAFREQWLLDQVAMAKAEGMMDEAEEQRILGSIKDPFIQTYLKCVAVHFCLAPTTHVISTLVTIYYWIFQAQSWEEAAAGAAIIQVAFTSTPISPGSLARGTYVAWRMIRDRNVKDYWIAMLLSFWHYVGYLSFPIQMVARFPGLARFMGGTWATRAARVIPVFGEKGALLEHVVFDSFFNVPLSLKALFTRKPQAPVSEPMAEHP